MLAALLVPRHSAAAAVAVIEMRGTARGERIWFSPQGLAVAAGTTIRFINRDPGNSHTATAYHPSLYGRTRRIPAAATPWDSDFLLPGDMFEIKLRWAAWPAGLWWGSRMLPDGRDQQPTQVM